MDIAEGYYNQAMYANDMKDRRIKHLESEIERLRGRIETLQEVVRDNHKFAAELDNDRQKLRDTLIKIKQESSEDHTREWANQALMETHYGSKDISAG